MRVIVISDIHSNLEALEAVASSMGDFDAIFCLGDLVGYGADPNEVVDKVRLLEPQVVIAGNHDYAVVSGDTSGFASHAALAVEWTRRTLHPRNMSYLANLPHRSLREEQGLRLGMYHGSPRDPLDEYVFPGTPEFILRGMVDYAGVDILMLGHTHMPMQVNIGSRYLLNPGSVGQPRDGDPRASYLILDLEGGHVKFELRRIKYDIDSAAEKILSKPVPKFLADRLYLGY
ncbi:MAG: metallophosphoesterase family protein [Candidatus Bathyarchaeia archaeon]